MLYYEQSYCGLDGQPIEKSEAYRQLAELDQDAASTTIYTVDIPLGTEDA